MHSTIEIVAERRVTPAGTATVVSKIRGGGHFAGRLTAHGSIADVHLVGTAAGPLGGDEAVVVVRVGPGARLRLRSAAATLILPSRQRPDSILRIDAQVGDGGHLDLGLEPTVVCAGAVHHAELLVALEGDARTSIAEDVVLGRSGEPGGDWTGRAWVTRDDRPVLRHLIRSEVLGPGIRAIATRFDSQSEQDDELPSSAGDAVRMTLAAGGVLATAVGTNLVSARADLIELGRGPVPAPA